MTARATKPKSGKTSASAKGAKTPLAYEDISPWQEQWHRIPNWPAKWKASVEPTPSYFPDNHPRFIAIAHANSGEPVTGTGNSPAEAVLDACRTAIVTKRITKFRGKPVALPTMGELEAELRTKQVTARKIPLTSISNGWKRLMNGYDYRRRGTYAKAGRNKDVPMPSPVGVVYLPYHDDVESDYDPGTPGNYDSYDRRQHSLTFGSPRLTPDPKVDIKGIPGSWNEDYSNHTESGQWHINVYSKTGKAPQAGDMLYFLRYDYDAPDYYEGDYGLTRFEWAFDSYDDALEAARYHACGRLGSYDRELVIEPMIIA